jgi:hypothetical protein
LAIYSGSTLVKTWNLQSTSTGRVNYVSPVRTSATATVTLKSTIAGRQILVDALGLLR